MKSYLLIIMSLFFLLTWLPARSQSTWQLLYQPRQRVVKSIGIYKDQIFIGTGNGVLISKDDGKTWEDFGTSELLKDSTGLSYINWIYIDEENKKIYIATNFGAYYSDVSKPDWHRFFENVKTESNEVNSLTVGKNEVYLSTNDGFWICNLNLGSCARLNQGLEPDNVSGNFQILYSLKVNDDICLAASNGIYKLNQNKSSWQNISNGIQKLPGALQSLPPRSEGQRRLVSGTVAFRIGPRFPAPS